MATDLQSVYSAKLTTYREQLRGLEKTIRMIVTARIAIALVTIWMVFMGFSNSTFFYVLPVPIAFFLYLVSRYSYYSERKSTTERLIQLNEWELKALAYEFPHFESGDRFKDEHHSFSYDLDLFGPGSLFQYLNRCASFLGEQRLALDLLTTETSVEKIRDRQTAVRELGPMLDLREKLWAIGKGTEGKAQELSHLNEWLSEKNWVKGSLKLSLLRWVFPTITISSLLLTYYDSAYISVFLVLFSIQWTLVSLYSSRISRTLLLLVHYKQWLENYGLLLREFAGAQFQSSLLHQHQQLAKEANDEVTRFSRHVNTLESRMNPIANAFGNGLFSFDLHSIASLEEWRDKNGHRLNAWFESLAEWDALNSLAHFHFTHPSYAFAQLGEELKLTAKDLGHPLIPHKGRVNNDCTLNVAPQVMIITGANMAGKSTFLRALGVNFVLSQAGAPVCASAWTGPVAGLRSGMRTTDSLQDHQSYFFAELKRLESIVRELREGKRMIVLLDEILKGTNSDDKQAGSRELILQLIQLPSLVFLATHDVVLGAMAQEKPSHIMAACFESEIKAGKLHFDYRLKKGVAQTRNATFLMRQMNIIPPEV